MQYNQENLCLYYQATVVREKCWLLTGLLRSFDHLAFDRTLDKSQSIFEFFVPVDQENAFLQIMNHFQHISLISNLVKLPNRLQDSNSQF